MATFTPNIPPSTFLKAKGGKEDDGPRRQTKEEYRKMKELEEGRKAGTVPAMTDIDTGKDINPHIPHYIANAPWYVGADGPTLKHQRPHPERQVELADITDNYKRGVSTKVATKFRKGACENCGSMTHKKKDCFERPRKIGAQFTGEDIAPDEYIPEELTQSYDAKRDRWQGFDSTEYGKVMEEYKRLEEARKIVKAQQLENTAAPAGDEETKEEEKEEDEDKDQDLDEDKYAEHADMPGVKLDVDSRTRITVRNLRIREDTAKYLYNLDPESAYYDPKSRAMRDNPFKGTNKAADEVPFAGDNFKRYTGEVVDVNKIQLFAWDAHSRGVDVHVLAEPTKLEALKKEFETRKHVFKDSNQQAIFDKYGGEEYAEAPPKELLLAQTEAYVEYNRKGKVVKGVERTVVKSKYEEDVYPNNHTTVWGSYWKEGRWGFKCCHSFIKHSYCTGEEGKRAQEQSSQFADPDVFRKKTNDGESSKKKEDAEESSTSSSSSSSTSSSSSSESESSADETTKKEREELERKRAAKRTEQNRKKKIAKQANLRKKRKLTNEDADKSGKRRKADESDASTSSDDDEEAKRKTNLRKALIEQAKKEREGEKMRDMDDRDRPYHSNYEVKQLNEYELEAYKLRKIHPDDPMAKYFDKGKNN